MNDFTDRLQRISEAKQELFRLVLQKKQRLGSRLASLAISASAMSVDAMGAEAVLSSAIDPARAQPAAAGEPGDILLTGATGFLGGFLLSALLARTRARIHCLVRADNAVHGHQRIAANLAVYLLPPADHRRIIPLPGDLSAPSLGLPTTVFDRLASEIDVIHHCGATVKWTYPYSSLCAVNVAGTQEILQLASTKRVKPVHFISTIGVFSSPDYRSDVVQEDEVLENSGPLYVGYAQTKWVAERLVWRASERGLPVTVYRPNTAPDSLTGAFNRKDHVSQMIAGCIQLGAVPDMPIRISGAPVDFVASAIAQLSCRPESAGHAFHLLNPVGIAWADLGDWMRRYGYPVGTIPFADWRERLAMAVITAQSTVLTALSPLFTEAIIDKVRLPVFDTRMMLKELQGSGLTCPTPTFDRFRLCLDYFTRNKFIDFASKSPT